MSALLIAPVLIVILGVACTIAEAGNAPAGESATRRSSDTTLNQSTLTLLMDGAALESGALSRSQLASILSTRSGFQPSVGSEPSRANVALLPPLRRIVRAGFPSVIGADTQGDEPRAPSRVVTATKTGSEGQAINFTGSFTDPGILDPHTTRWNFGDGVLATGELNPTHAYDDNGSYTATLEITDSGGATGIATIDVEIFNVSPTVSLVAPSLIKEGDETEFVATVSDPGKLDTHTFLWWFGIGSSVSGAQTVTHKFLDDGTFLVLVDVVDDDGGLGTATVSVTVTNVAPTAEAGSSQTVDEGSVVQFQGSFQDPGILDTHTILWQFGDGGQVQSTLSPTHTYVDDGQFIVTLTVTDDEGESGTDALIVNVINRPPEVQIGP